MHLSKYAGIDRIQFKIESQHYRSEQDDSPPSPAQWTVPTPVLSTTSKQSCHRRWHRASIESIHLESSIGAIRIVISATESLTCGDSTRRPPHSYTQRGAEPAQEGAEATI